MVTIINNPQQAEVEALKKFAETPPLKPSEPRAEQTSEQADAQAFEQFAKERKTETASVPILEAPAKEPPSPMPTEQEVKAMEKDPVTIETEKILEDGLGSTYNALPEKVKPFFRQHGEHAAKTIADMIKRRSFDPAVALDLTTAWMQLVPKANKYYLEQESKLKIDELAAYADTVKNDANLKLLA